MDQSSIIVRKDMIYMKSEYPVIDTVRTGQNIKRIMKVRNYTVRDVQHFLGLGSPQSIYHWFSGKSMPTLDNIYALSELFYIPVDRMIVGNRRFAFTPTCNDMCDRIYAYYLKMYPIKANNC